MARPFLAELAVITDTVVATQQTDDSRSCRTATAPPLDTAEVIKIVIAGAPCAGKSEALPKLQAWVEHLIPLTIHNSSH